jgi:chemotaxis methyl-accepting protein methylase
MKSTIKRVAEILSDVRGVDITKYDKLFLEKSLSKRVSDRLCMSLEEYCSLLKEDVEECRLFS